MGWNEKGEINWRIFLHKTLILVFAILQPLRFSKNILFSANEAEILSSLRDQAGPGLTLCIFTWRGLLRDMLV